MSAPTIERIHTTPVSPAVRADLLVSGARGTHDRSDFLLVRVVTSDGVDGIGEVSATLTWSGEDSTTAQHVIERALAPALIGRPLLPVVGLEAEMDRVLAGNPFTKAGVSIALWDAYAKSLGVPLTVALGGPRRREIPIKCSLSGNGDRLRAPASNEPGRRGSRRSRSRSGWSSTPTSSASRSCGRWSVRRRSSAWTPTAATDGPMPTTRWRGWPATDRPSSSSRWPPGDLVGMAALRGLGLPIVADESVFGRDDLMAVIRADAADVISLYVGKSGGPGRAVEMASIAEAAGLEVILGSNGELGVGAAAQLHVACAAAGLSETIPSDIIGAHYYESDVLASGIDSDGTRARLGDAPGLGVVLRDDLMDALGAE